MIGFIAGDSTEQTEQFILVNSTKPLPKGLIYELLPTTGGRLPTPLERRRFPAQLLARLNIDEDSPLQGMIHTPTVPDGIIKDNSVLRMLEHSLSDGVLYRFKTRGSNDGDEESMLEILNAFWSTVAEVFPDAWGISPKRSRLMHGAGIVSLGFVMDAIADRYRKKNPGAKEFRKKPQTPGRALPLDRGLLGFRTGPAKEVERDPEYAEGYSVAEQFLVGAVSNSTQRPLIGRPSEGLSSRNPVLGQSTEGVRESIRVSKTAIAW